MLPTSFIVFHTLLAHSRQHCKFEKFETLIDKDVYRLKKKEKWSKIVFCSIFTCNIVLHNTIIKEIIHNYLVSINLKYSDDRKRFKAHITDLHEISSEFTNKLLNF